ncbi:hypothetical protein NMG60_11033169 [Bertholletia excelsa]
MANKGITTVKPWIEVAPPPLLLPQKPSNCPKLETIREEMAEGRDDEDGWGPIWFRPWRVVSASSTSKGRMEWLNLWRRLNNCVALMCLLGVLSQRGKNS